MALLDRFGGSGWRTVAALARPYRRQLLVVALFALLATGTDLLAPLIYRAAVNDIAGVFVGSSSPLHTDPLAEVAPRATPAALRPDPPTAAARNSATAGREPHRRGRVAPRSPAQAFTTLMWAVVLLFTINEIGRAHV